eukprot:gene15532-17117_t
MAFECEGAEAKKFLLNLKKRHNKRRNDLKKVERSGTSTEDQANFKANLKRKKPSMNSSISEVTGRTKWQKEKPDLDRIELQFSKKMDKVIVSPEEKEKKEDRDIFGMLVAAEIMKLNTYNRVIAKYQIQNMIFQLQMTQQQQEQNQSQAEQEHNQQQQQFYQGQ